MNESKKDRIEFQIRKGRKILSRHKSKAEAGRSLGRLMYDYNNLALVKVIIKTKLSKK